MPRHSAFMSLSTNELQRSAASDKSQQRVRLPDGRYLGYAEYGDPGGLPVFYFHGFPGSRFEARLARQEAASLGIRLISVDRPGYGLSDEKRGRTLLDWADDTVHLADFLSVRSFSAVGVSGGGPYAAACAFKIPHRLNKVAIVCGLGPVVSATGRINTAGLIATGLLIAGKFPILAQMPFAASALMYRHNPALMLRFISRRLAACDRRALQLPQLHALLCNSFREAFRSSLLGPARDLVLYGRDWGFALHDIHVPTRLWHGEQDAVVPPAMGHLLANEIPTCRAVFYPHDGHFSIITNHLGDVLAEHSRG